MLRLSLSARAGGGSTGRLAGLAANPRPFFVKQTNAGVNSSSPAASGQLYVFRSIWFKSGGNNNGNGSDGGESGDVCSFKTSQVEDVLGGKVAAVCDRQKTNAA